MTTLAELAQRARRLEVMEQQGVVIPNEVEEPDDTNIDYSSSDGTEPSMDEDKVLESLNSYEDEE